MKLKDFFQNRSWKKWEKSQWSILILVGMLLMVIAIPTKDKEKEVQKLQEEVGEDAARAAEVEKEDYVRKLEQRLCDTLSRLEGAGAVEVMITLEDSGESIVEKDTSNETSTLQEADSAGGSRSEKNAQTARSTVYREESSEKMPFIGKEMTPKVAGVLVVAQGGDQTAVKQNISEAVMALFQIDVNRIKVVKMNMQEEEY